jgi:holliday junction resolvase Hjr
MFTKAKGTKAERELIHMFWEKGWAALRVAGSGSIRYPSPDIIAGNNLRKLAVECKAVAGMTKYISLEQVEELNSFARIFGAEPWIGVRFDKMNWYFIGTADLVKTESSAKISIEEAKRMGLLFEEMIS